MSQRMNRWSAMSSVEASQLTMEKPPMPSTTMFVGDVGGV
jgi:hypothetical protein